jgi:hypothetical protein
MKTIAQQIIANDQSTAIDLAEKQCVDEDQDWDNGISIYIFADSSGIKFCENDMELI